MSIGIVASRFNGAIVSNLPDGATDRMVRLGVAEDAIELVWVPGAFEIPLAANALAETGRVDTVLCLGAVIRGATPHFEHVDSRPQPVALRSVSKPACPQLSVF